MRARLFTLIMILAISLTISAQQKKVAVYMTGEDSGVNKVLGDQLVAAFARSGKYVAVERTASFLAELGKEHSYQRTGAISDNQIAALGVQFGVNYVCVADVSEVFGEKYISARLIDVETAEIVNTHNVSGQMNSMSKCLAMANEIATNLTKGTFKEQATEEARRKEVERLEELKTRGYVDLGLPSGILWKDKNETGGYYTYDRAISKYGDNLPTKEQLEELKTYCRWTWNGSSCKVTGSNGQSISLPATGYRSGIDERVYGMGSYGIYCSSTPSGSDVWILSCGKSGDVMIYKSDQRDGMLIRLIQKP